MKKLLVCLLTLALGAASAMGAASALEAADVVGTWYLNYVEQSGASVNPATLGMEITLTLKEDGTALLASLDSEHTTDWRLDGDKVIVDEAVDAMEFTLADGNLEIDLDGMVLVFGKEVTNEGTFAAPPVVPATALSDFDGEWLGSLVVTGGISMPPDQAGLSLFASISAGNIKLRFVAATVERETESQGTLEDGALFAVRDNEGEEEQMLLQLHDDGSLSITFTGDDAEYQAYFEPAVPPGA